MASQRTSGRNEQEIEQLVAGYERSGLTRTAYSHATGVAVSTLDYYRRRRARRVALVPVRVASPESAQPLTLVAAHGRRIEVPAGFDENALLRLLRVVERT